MRRALFLTLMLTLAGCPDDSAPAPAPAPAPAAQFLGQTYVVDSAKQTILVTVDFSGQPTVREGRRTWLEWARNAALLPVPSGCTGWVVNVEEVRRTNTEQGARLQGPLRCDHEPRGGQ